MHGTSCPCARRRPRDARSTSSSVSLPRPRMRCWTITFSPAPIISSTSVVDLIEGTGTLPSRGERQGPTRLCMNGKCGDIRNSVVGSGEVVAPRGRRRQMHGRRSNDSRSSGDIAYSIPLSCRCRPLEPQGARRARGDQTRARARSARTDHRDHLRVPRERTSAYGEEWRCGSAGGAGHEPDPAGAVQAIRKTQLRLRVLPVVYGFMILGLAILFTLTATFSRSSSCAPGDNALVLSSVPLPPPRSQALTELTRWELRPD